nr:tRNA uridine-5-carboxymethylaminomethyl(34) synthesis GTPase MnmE [Candidatus Latescibacterota bacterium]
EDTAREPVPAAEGEADLDGVRVRFVDTAGLRETGDAVEREGTKRAGRAASAADVVLLVCDGSGEIPWDLTPVSGRNAIIVINKMDKARNEVLSVLSASAGSTPVFRVSALSGEGLDTLCRGIRDALCADAPEPKTGGVIIRARHADALSAAGSHLERALDEATGQARSELVAADIRLALDALGSITGETTPEDIIRRIFSEFCVGK